MDAIAEPVLFAYDGSEDAKQAIRAAGELLGGRAIVVHAYATPTPALAVPGPGTALAVEPAITAEVEQSAHERARSVLREGVELARAAGFDPEPEFVTAEGTHAVWKAIVDAAQRRKASVIVIGHAQLSWIEEKLLGRVDTDVIKHAGRAVLVVPGHLG